MRKKIIIETDGKPIVGEVLGVSFDQSGPFCVPKCTVEFYIKDDSKSINNVAKELFNAFNGKRVCDMSRTVKNASLTARKVVFNPPATIVLWEDGTKTVVKCDPEDVFDEMKGMALCYMKKALGNTSRELNKALRRK